jgi:hypothetical protein
VPVAAAALVAAGCGSQEDGSAGGSVATAPVSTAPATAPATAPTTAPVTSPEDAPGGAGDETPARVTAAFALGAGGTLDPARRSVQAFLAMRVAVDNRDAVAHVVRVADVELRVPAGRSAGLDLPGRRPGRLAVLVDGTRRATLVVG